MDTLEIAYCLASGRSVGILNNVIFKLKYFFSCLLGPASTYAVNTPEGK